VDRLAESILKQNQIQNKADLQDVNPVKKSEMGIIETNKKLEKENKRKKQKKKNKNLKRKVLEEEAGLLIDLEG
jgi:hypothetical protein